MLFDVFVFLETGISPGLQSLPENLFGNHFRESMNVFMIPSHLYPYTCDGIFFLLATKKISKIW